MSDLMMSRNKPSYIDVPVLDKQSGRDVGQMSCALELSEYFMYVPR